MLKHISKKVSSRVVRDNENGSRKAVLEDLFYDFNKSRIQVYHINFFRGLFFGFGSVLGGTLLIAAFAWVLHFFVFIPGIGGSVRQVENTITTQKK